VLLADILADQWRGPANDIDWDIAQARVLFADFAGMLRIPMKPATHSKRKPATCSDLKPAGIPI
jgi:hypothetical protein